MRRQTAGTCEVPRGSGRSIRLDPFALPARVTFTSVARNGSAVHTVVLGRETVMIHRVGEGRIPLTISVPISSYRGILLSTGDDGGMPSIMLRLLHLNNDLVVPLRAGGDTDDAVVDWSAWGRMLRRPLLFEDADGCIREPYERLGGVILRPVKARRVNKFFAERRPMMLCRRQVGGRPSGVIHREDEIIARDVAD